MKLPNILPPTDLLKELEGVEDGLRQRRRLGVLGWIGVLGSATLQILVTIVNSDWWEALRTFDYPALLAQWPYLLPLVLLAGFFVLAVWSQFWLEASQESFRYTCSIDEFVPIDAAQVEPKLGWLSHDLARLLSERVSRLRFLDPGTAPSKDPGASHIHVRGHYLVRPNARDERVVEVMPRVRIGGPESPEALARSVEFRLKELPVDKSDPTPSSLRASDYRRLLERVYFRIATSLYEQIERDVSHKVELLPNAHFRAVALYYEANDYAESNTLDAYEEAARLYQRSFLLFDPALRTAPTYPIHRLLHRVRGGLADGGNWLEARLARIRPAIGRRQVLCAQAETGFANMLLYRRQLAGLSGLRLNSIFEARPVARRAVQRLEQLPPEVPNRNQALFEAYVATALAHGCLNDRRGGKEWLEKARRLDPNRTEEDARYLYVKGEMDAVLVSRLHNMRRATELEPRFEVAQWALGMALERLWRRRPTFERSVAKEIFRQYDEVLLINPGNIGAWANLGYIHWLLGNPEDLDRANECFEHGLDYKSIKRHAFVAELDYGLTRLAAERGDFALAYSHYIRAVAALLAQGAQHGTESYATYFFNDTGQAVFDRFQRYRDTVEKLHGDALPQSEPGGRIRNAILGFVLNDFGEACFFNRFLGEGDERYLEQGRESVRRAVQLSPNNAIFLSNLAGLLAAGPSTSDQLEVIGEALRCIDAAVEKEPLWPQGWLGKSRLLARWEPMARRQAADLRAKAKDAAARKAPAQSSAAVLRQLGVHGANGAMSPGGETEPAQDYERRALELEAQANRAREEATLHPQQLIPLDWLWTSADAGGRRTLNWSALKSRAYRRELRWERSFDDIRAHALVAWADVFARQCQAEGIDEKIQLERRRQLHGLYNQMEEVFWPADFGLLRQRRDLVKGDPASTERYSQRLHELIKDLVVENPSAYWALQLLDSLPDEMVRPLLLKVATNRGVSPRLLSGIGEHLYALGDHHGARLALITAKAHASPDVMVALARGFAKLQDSAEALKLFRQGYRTLEAENPGEYTQRLGAFYWQLGRFGDAIQQFRSVSSNQGDPGAGWRRRLIAKLAGPTCPQPEYRLVKSWLHEQSRECLKLGDRRGERDANEARLEWTAQNYPRFVWPEGGLPDKSRPLPPMVTPIAVEIDEQLLPKDEKVAEKHEFLQRYIPEMREQLWRDLGIRVPGVRVRSSTLLRNAGVIFIDETPLVQYELKPDRWFCPDRALLPADLTPSALPTIHPVTGRDTAGWLPRSAAPEPRPFLWDHFRYLTAALEGWLRREAERFIGLQELENILEAWPEDGASPDGESPRDLVAKVLPTTESRLFLLQVLKRLLQEQVPIVDLPKILQALHKQPPGAFSDAEVLRLVAAVRQDVRERLPGNSHEFAHVGLSADIEREIHENVRNDRGHVYLQLDPKKTTAILAGVRKAVDGLAEPPVLVTHRDDIRRFVRRLVELEHPQLFTLSLRELRPQLRGRIRRMVHHGE